MFLASTPVDNFCDVVSIQSSNLHYKLYEAIRLPSPSQRQLQMSHSYKFQQICQWEKTNPTYGGLSNAERKTGESNIFNMSPITSFYMWESLLTKPSIETNGKPSQRLAPSYSLNLKSLGRGLYKYYLSFFSGINAGYTSS